VWERNGGLLISDSLTALIRKQEIAVNLRRLEEDDLCYVCLCVIGCVFVLVCVSVREGEKRGESSACEQTSLHVHSSVIAVGHVLYVTCSWVCFCSFITINTMNWIENY